MTSAEVIERLRDHGFLLVSIRGSHRKLRNASGVVVVIPHPKKDLGKGPVAAIWKQAGIKAARGRD
jgi:predicted RNA binding protein YcfA (HicA-like mRNA interferase family)